MPESKIIQADTKDKILTCASLPALPSVAVNILDKLKDSGSNPAEVTELIECEPAICSRVLSLANSPLYGLSRPVTTLAHAVVLLGVPAVCQLAVSISTQNVFCSGEDPEVLALRKKIYEQSLATASNARILATHFGLPSPDETFLSGIMQDIGKLVLLAELGTEYGELLTAFPSGETTDLEQKWIGLGHDELGEICGRRWGLPLPINLAIKNHHLPFEEIKPTIPGTLAAANYFSRGWHIAFDDSEQLPISEAIEEQFNSAQLCEIEALCKDSFAAIKAICT